VSCPGAPVGNSYLLSVAATSSLGCTYDLGVAATAVATVSAYNYALSASPALSAFACTGSSLDKDSSLGKDKDEYSGSSLGKEKEKNERSLLSKDDKDDKDDKDEYTGSSDGKDSRSLGGKATVTVNATGLDGATFTATPSSCVRTAAPGVVFECTGLPAGPTTVVVTAVKTGGR
jgi:hypothetical protein